MGIWDWLKKKPEEPDQKPAEIVVDLPELDKDALLEETKSASSSVESAIQKMKQNFKMEPVCGFSKPV